MNSDLALDLSASNGTNVSHIERFQSLQSGQYWRATREISREAITEGMVLLIQSIRWVEEKPHTIILRSHPTVIGRPQTVRWVDEHGEHERTAKFTEHRILLDDFLAGFEFEPHAKQFRDRELQQAQAQVQQLQAELLTAQSNPEVMAAVVRLRLSSPDDAVEGAPGSSLAVQFDPSDVALATGPVSQALNTELTESRIDQLRSAAVQQHSLAAAKASWIQEKTKEIGRAISAITPFFEEQAAAALASTEEVREYALKLSKGIESLDLYVGRGVTVETITTGESAPAEEPLTFVQKKLFMCEELAIWADVGDTFDFEDEHIFFDALRTKPALVEQIFPAKRCVLCMAVTRDDVNYKDAFTSAERNAENKSVFLLVRDGDNIHRVFSPVESHRYFTRLFPSVEESEARFTGIDGTTIKFEDIAYTDHLAKHEAAALHYKRLLILACGLDHRLKLFGHFYPDNCTFDFVSLQFQADYCRFIHDDDQHTMLQGEPLQPLQEWIAERNKYLTSGSRVICNWRALMNPDTAPGACTPTRDSFILDYKPGKRFDICKATKSGADLVVEVPVRGYTNRGEEREFNCRVNLSAYRYGYWRYEDLAFLCLDTVREEDLQAYMRSRESRRDHVFYIRLFKHALAHLQAERSEELGTRQLMREALIDGGVCDAEKIDTVIDETVRSWRAANRGAPLPRAEGGHTPRQWPSILDQMYIISGNGKESTSIVSEMLRPLGMAPLRLVSNGKTGLAVYATPAQPDRDDRLFPHEWVKRISLPLKKGRLHLGAVKDVRLSSAIASEVTIHEWPAAQAWMQISPSSFESLASKTKLMALCEGATEKLLALRGPMHEDAFELLFNEWRNARYKANRKGKFVSNPDLFVPVGMLAQNDGKKLRLLGIGSTDAHAILYKLAPTDDGKKRVKHAYVSIYSNKESARMRFEESVQAISNWELLEAELPGPKSELGLFTHANLNVNSATPSRYRVEEVASPLLGDDFQALAKQWEKDQARYWIHPSVANQDGSLGVDKTLGIELPQDFRPVRVFDVRFTEEKVGKFSWLITEPDANSSDLFKQGSYSARLFPTISAARKHIEVSAAGRAAGTELRLHETVGAEPAVLARFDLR